MTTAGRFTREEVHVVGLAGNMRHAIEFHVWLGAAGCKDRTSLRHPDGVLARALLHMYAVASEFIHTLICLTVVYKLHPPLSP